MFLVTLHQFFDLSSLNINFLLCETYNLLLPSTLVYVFYVLWILESYTVIQKGSLFILIISNRLKERKSKTIFYVLRKLTVFIIDINLRQYFLYNLSDPKFLSEIDIWGPK